MTVREYIGARYVPLFMGAWDVTANYEPLSVVTYQGNSYTSRQAVPAGVDIANELYWAETGSYNAQVEAYRQEVLTFDNRITQNSEDIDTLEGLFPIGAANIQTDAITTVKIADDAVTADKIADDSVTSDKIADDAVTADKIADNAATADKIANNAITTAKIADIAVSTGKIADNAVTDIKLSSSLQRAVSRKHMVVIGDSFSTPAYSTEPNMWYTGVGRQQNLNVHNYAISGTGYIHSSSINNNFNIQMQRAIDDTNFNNDDVRLVIIFGGLNDYNDFSGTNLYTAAVSLIETAKANFPHAKIIVAGINTYMTFYSTQLYNMTLQLRNAAFARGVSFINTLLLLFGSNLLNPDNLNHPNNAGQLAIASWFNSAISGTPSIAERYYAASEGTTNGTLQFIINGSHIESFGTMRTDANGNCTKTFEYGIGYLINKPFALFNQNAAKPIAYAAWDYANGLVKITGATPNTSYTSAEILMQI